MAKKEAEQAPASEDQQQQAVAVASESGLYTVTLTDKVYRAKLSVTLRVPPDSTPYTFTRGGDSSMSSHKIKLPHINAVRLREEGWQVTEEK